MTSTIDLLNEKNMHLEKFFRLNEAELEKFSVGDFSGLDYFYRTRDGLLDIIKKLDEMIERTNDIVLDKSQIDNSMKRAIITSLEYKNDLVARILEQDLTILAAIEKAKTEIIKELSQVRGAKKAIGAYHSGTAKTRLDEEA